MSSEEIINYQKIQTFPKQTIEKIIRSVLPKKLRISDEFKTAVNRCAQIYVISVAATAQNHFKTSHLTEEQVIQIIDLMGFPEFVEPLEEYRKELIEKKSKPKNSKKNNLKVENSGEQPLVCSGQSSDPKCDSIAEDIDCMNEINTKLFDKKKY